MVYTAKTNSTKRNGIHYTPDELARFLAEVLVKQLPVTNGTIRVLDPACGNGVLLKAFFHALPNAARLRCELVGFEIDSCAAELAREQLNLLGAAKVSIQVKDFLSESEASTLESGGFEALITNPPYVRTQVMGAATAQKLANDFALTGRVDLYQAFLRASANVLKPGGALGLLTSNRFLTTKSGESTRRMLRREFSLKNIFDLGDTKLFKAAVLPVIVVAIRTLQTGAARSNEDLKCTFDRIYRYRNSIQACGSNECFPTVLDALREKSLNGVIQTSEGQFQVERGELPTTGDDAVWSLSTCVYQSWLNTVTQHQRSTFDDVAKIRVGIKTTADDVFLRENWNSLPEDLRPESTLIRPLIRHFDAMRWVPKTYSQSVVYPHEDSAGLRRPITLDEYPRARKYFEQHRARLTKRHYLIQSGRKWYEIWVPHSPSAWSQPKIVYPDISEEPRFFLDHSGAVVNGDCYWITLRPGIDPKMLLLMLAVANSSFITKYYDIVFHNKLYAGRRRYMTQYVKNFPLPDIDGKCAQKIVDSAASLVSGKRITTHQEKIIDRYVWNAFGFDQPE